jgi:hypothetical protein
VLVREEGVAYHMVLVGDVIVFPDVHGEPNRHSVISELCDKKGRVINLIK